MKQTDFIPRKDAVFETFFWNIVEYVKANAARWGHIPLAEVERLEEVFGGWSRAYAETRVPHIPQLTAEKNRVRAVSERSLRLFVNRFLRFEPVSDLDRDEMGIHNRDTVRTKQPAPATVPEIETDTSLIRALRFRLRDMGSTHWAKPDHARAMELAWEMRDDRPAAVGEMGHFEVATANPITLTFMDGQRGSRVFFAARWINNTALKGPWSDIKSAFIP